MIVLSVMLKGNDMDSATDEGFGVVFDIGGTLLIRKDRSNTGKSDVNNEINILEGGVQLLLKVKSFGAKVACLSNVDEKNDSRREFPELFSLFDACFMSYETNFRKPSDEAFFQAQSFFKFESTRMVMVGDSLVADILPALSLGWSAVWFNHGVLGVEWESHNPCLSVATTASEIISKIAEFKHVRYNS